MSGYLLDTNIVSEIRKKRCDKNVINWINSIPAQELFISVLTIGEIRKGIEMLVDTEKKAQLIAWLDFNIVPWFDNNIISIDKEISERWGYISSIKNIPAIDGLIAATAMVKNLILVTRNIKDFNIPIIEMINPFEN